LAATSTTVCGDFAVLTSWLAAYTLPTLPNTKAFKWLSIKSRVKGFFKYSEILEETLSYFSNTSISEEEYWQIYECLTKNKPFCMIMCWSEGIFKGEY
jgi:hypothetical protein